ncbi:MAG: SpoIIE family protein phosphatase [Desulfatirhabdiaceae bacterium]
MEDQTSTNDKSVETPVPSKGARPIQEAILTGILCLIALGVSIHYIHNRALLALQEEIKAGLARNVSAAATTIDGDIHRNFLSKSQKEDPEYIGFIKKMEDIRQASKNVRYIYTNIMVDGKIFFIANPSPQNDADGDGKPDEAPQLMDPYPDAGEALMEALTEKRLAVDKLPYTDKWGTFYSAYAPFYDHKGEFVGTLGMDLELLDFENRTWPILRATIIAAIVGSLLSLVCALQVWFFRRKQLKYEMQLANTNKELAHSNEIIKNELNEAEKYVISLFPPAITAIFPPASNTAPVVSDWIYQSCSELGGDSFGYHWIDEDHFAAYLIDVCGHGVGAALHSVTVISSIRNMILPNVDFKKPAEVVYALNNAFTMEKYNNTYFTIWYGVYNQTTGILEYSSGGHPPAVLIDGDSESKAELKYLSTPGLVVGSMPDAPYRSNTVKIKEYNKLFIFSDGVYEIEYADKKGMMTLKEFAEEISKPVSPDERKVEQMLHFARKAQNSETFEDDFTLMELSFLQKTHRQK